MQPDLPWNVAGIPPEAREAARAAARREGLSVGEWLTRKILRTMSEAAGGIESTTQAWRNAASSSADAYRTVAESAANATRDTEDMLARVSRSEDETHSAYNRIENHLKAVARRLDSAERSQSENNRAMSKAAAEINVAAREQAQAFDQLDSHVMALSERLSRLEQNAAGNSGLKDAVKGLHNGLSRLADQIGETANQSATQISTLAENVETLASRLTQARHDADAAAKALKDHLLAVDERLKTVETQDGAANALTDMRTSLDGLSARMAEGEAQNAGAMARLEDNIAQLQQASEDKDAGPRLDVIEQGLSELSARVDAPPEAVPETVSEELRQIGERLDAADQQHRREIAELHEALEGLEEASKPQSRPESPQVFADEAAAEPPLPMNVVMNGGLNDAMNDAGAAHGFGFDLPPFPAAASMHEDAPQASHEATFEAPPFPADNEPQPFEAGIGYPDEHQFSGVQPFSTALGHEYDGAMGNGFTPGQQSAEDFIANTRRQARAAAIETEAGGAPMSGFAWSAGRTEEPEAKSGGRFGMIALAVLLIAGALAAGLYVFRDQARGPLSLMHRSTPASATRAAPPASATTPAPEPMGAQPQTQTQTQTQGDAAAAAPQDSPAAAAPTPAPHHKTAHARTRMRKTEVSASAPAPVRKAPVSKAAAPKTAVHTGTRMGTRTAPKPATLSPLAQLTNEAKSGDTAAETLLGLKYLNGDGVGTNEAEAARWLERAAKQGQPVAEYRLGTLYERGHGMPANAALAVRWYERAASHGNRKAMHNLAVAYAQGAGVPKDFKKAALWFGRAARLGLRDSQFNLAVLYERGMGVRQNLGEAFKWYSVAARAGDSESKARVAALGPQLKPAARNAAERAASRFVPAQLNRAANAAPVLASR